MSTVDEAAGAAVPRAVEARSPRQRRRGGNWWRHVVAIAAIAFALFPVAYVVSAAFNADQSLSGSSLIPRAVTLDNFRELFSTQAKSTSTYSSAHYLRWFANTLIVASATAILTVLVGALAAYAFSRFRFRGRKLGMLFLLLIQMFPQLLLVVAIYLIVLNTSDVFPAISLNSFTTLIIVYLGGAMGVNAWLLKGFFDTIPSELDESARVDGATPAQIFWGVVLPLATPVLAVIALLSFIGTVNEFVIVSVLMQTNDHFTLAVGLRGYIDNKYAEHWGPFAAGVLLAAIPAVLLFGFLQRFIVAGLTQGAVKG